MFGSAVPELALLIFATSSDEAAASLAAVEAPLACSEAT